jgi:CRISPR-associated protein Cas2
LLERDLLEKMVGRLEKVVNEEEDSVRVYALCANCQKVIKVMGQGEVTKEEKYYIL